MKNLKMYCVTNKVVNFLDKTNYDIGWVGLDAPPANYITCNHQDNIFFKEQFYSELTFHYWYWKNKLILNDPNWIGFCQKRRFLIKKESLNKNGIMFFDDAMHKFNNKIKYQVFEGLKYFLKMFENEIEILYLRNILVIRKK